MIIVDDETNIRFFLRNVAKLLKINVVGEAKDGAQAVDLYRQEVPDLVLMDINMPHMQGDEALTEILKQNPRASVVMLTSVADSEIVRQCIAQGAVNYILKNNKLEKIKELLTATVENI
jgi:two-component system chemotaxis response regulator CheY